MRQSDARLQGDDWCQRVSKLCLSGRKWKTGSDRYDDAVLLLRTRKPHDPHRGWALRASACWLYELSCSLMGAHILLSDKCLLDWFSRLNMRCGRSDWCRGCPLNR